MIGDKWLVYTVESEAAMTLNTRVFVLYSGAAEQPDGRGAEGRG